MPIKKISGHHVFRPSNNSEARFRKKAEENLLSSFSPGIYKDSSIINNIIKHQLSFFTKECNELIKKLSCWSFLEMLLKLYDETYEIESASKSRELNQNNFEDWYSFAAEYRRAIKHLCELCVITGNSVTTEEYDQNCFSEYIDDIFVYTEEMVIFYTLSDQTYSLFPDSTIVTITNEQGNLFDLKIEDSPIPLESGLQKWVRQTLDGQDKYFGKLTFDTEINNHEEILGEVFKKVHGITFKEALQIITSCELYTKPQPDRMGIVFINKLGLVDVISKNLNKSTDEVILALNGFTISQKNLSEEGFEIFKPKRHYRPFRRAFFEFPHETGVHLTWSKGMVLESFAMLVSDTVFKKFPKEWTSPIISSQIEILSKEASNWFEKQIKVQLEKFGFHCLLGVKKYLDVNSNKFKQIEAGEMDLLGVSPEGRYFFLIECKMVYAGSEPQYFKSDLADFIKSEKSYKKKFIEKISWIKQNPSVVRKLLFDATGISFSEEKIKFHFCMLTFRPNISSFLIKEFPCSTAAEFLLKFEESKSWPYSCYVDI
jgi:hypothetical protein